MTFYAHIQGLYGYCRSTAKPTGRQASEVLVIGISFSFVVLLFFSFVLALWFVLYREVAWKTLCLLISSLCCSLMAVDYTSDEVPF